MMKWADSFRKLQVRTNADTPADAANAVKYGAEGIGLCRTEHMFFEEDRIPKIRQMILSRTLQEREKALNELIRREISRAYMKQWKEDRLPSVSWIPRFMSLFLQNRMILMIWQ